MAVYQLDSALALLAAVALSLVILWSSRNREGSIKLPQYCVSDEEDSEPELPGEKDPFDVSSPQDWSDGEPLDEDLFWSRMRVRKICLVLTYAFLLSIYCVACGYSSVVEGPRSTYAFGLHLASAIYLFGLSSVSLTSKDVATHWPITVHLSALSSFATVLLFTITIIPATKGDSNDIGITPVLTSLWCIALFLHFLAASIAVTTPRGPQLHFPSEMIYSLKTLTAATNRDKANVCGITDASAWSYMLFSYTTRVVMLGNTTESLEIGDLPIVSADMRASTIFYKMRNVMKSVRLRGRWKPKPGSGWETLWRLCVINKAPLTAEIALAATSALLFYAPAFFLQVLVKMLEGEPKDISWGYVYCAGLFGVNALMYLITGQLWSLSTTTIQSRLKIQLNSTLFAKCLVRKDVASSSGSGTSTPAITVAPQAAGGEAKEDKAEEDDFSSKAQIMTLMTTDVDRVSDFSWHVFSLVDSPIEIAIGTFFLYRLLGVSCFIGLAFTCLFLPLNHLAGKIVVLVQEGLMNSRDERVALMNEVLGAIRMIKFMAWERSFEKRIMKLREKELSFQRKNYIVETCFIIIWSATPILVTLVSFWHYAIYRGEILTPSVAFTSITIFAEMKFALNALPETFINMLQGFVSLRRIERYLISQDIPAPPPYDPAELTVMALNSATITWPQARFTGSAPSSQAPTPRTKFVLTDLNLKFPVGGLSLICGRLGSGKTLLLLGMLGESDLLTGQILVPRTPPDSIARFSSQDISDEEWIAPGICAYVPQTAWLQNASIKENVLFNLPFNEQRYKATLEACALVNDLDILEDGDESEIGERGVNLSGGQKARISLARAIYSRASILFLDDVLSAVDAHTGHHLYHECLLGPLMQGRTVILVSHHVQLCAPCADYIVALDNGRVAYQGDHEGFTSSGTMSLLVQRTKEHKAAIVDTAAKDVLEESPAMEERTPSESTKTYAESASSTVIETGSEVETKEASVKETKKPPRKLIEEEKRAVGRIGREVWENYILACGGLTFWTLFGSALLLATASPVVENGWLRVWSGSIDVGGRPREPSFYIAIYTGLTMFGLLLSALKWFILYYGGLHASSTLYKRLLETVLRANIRFHDTISRGRLLNRFGKDFEGIDSNLPDHFGRTLMYGLNVIVTIATITYVGGLPFFIAAIIIGFCYYNVAKVYGQTSRDMRRLDSVTRSPLYSIYGETISGVTIIRAFGAGSKFLRDMLRCVDTNTNPYFWMWGVNRWLSVRFNLLSSVVMGVTGLMVLITPSVDASLAGFALTFASHITNDLLFMVRRFVGLEQAMVAVERVQEFSELNVEPPEFIEPRPDPNWPHQGRVICKDLTIRYAPELPDVLHGLSFDIYPGEKVGILGRTGSGKSTLALSFFRFVEANRGSITIDGLDISKIGLTDLRRRLTIIPQDPTILSGSIRSTLDVFDEYTDADIYESLRRVHLIPQDRDVSTPLDGVDPAVVQFPNANVFQNLDTAVSEGGDNFSTGEKQLLCMARAILKRSKLLVMDEATASVDYATDELIGKTIREEFADSTILTIAHRLRTIIDYDRILVMEDGSIAEFDTPLNLLKDSDSKFYALCKATGPEEFRTLLDMAGVQ